VILPELGEDLGRYAQQKLAERKVDILLNTKVVEASAQTVKLGDSTVIPTNTLVWTAGVSPNPLIATLPLEKERGRIAANHDLSVAGWPGVWALGDCASIHDPRDGKAYPPTAQHALREGRVVAQNVLATLRGAPTRAFVHANIGQLAAIGRRTGVAKILGLKFSGFLAWWLWRSIYLSKLPRFNRKVRVALDWSLDILFSKDLVQFSTQPGDAISESEHQEQPPQRGSGGIAA
jgi:NADH dehydrogenase